MHGFKMRFSLTVFSLKPIHLSSYEFFCHLIKIKIKIKKSERIKFIRSYLKKGFWFKVKADANIKPEVPAKPMPYVVNTPVFRG